MPSARSVSLDNKVSPVMLVSPPGLILIGYGKTGRERRSAGEDPQALSVESAGSIFHSHRGLREQKGLDLRPAAG